MIEYTCERCYKTFDHKGNYNYHINRKIKCKSIAEKLEHIAEGKPELRQYVNSKVDEIARMIPCNVVDIFNNDLEKIEDDIHKKNVEKICQDHTSLTIYNPEFNEPNCVYCNRRFMNNSHRNRHMNSNCLIRKKYIDWIKVLDKELENLIIENKFLRSKYICLFGDKSLYPFGVEKIYGYDINLVIDAIKNPYKGIPDFIEAYHFNTLESRFNNIRIKNPKGMHLEIYNGTHWVIETKENIIQTLLRNYKDIIDMEVENVEEQMNTVFVKNSPFALT